jgi:hypothetical protein
VNVTFNDAPRPSRQAGSNISRRVLARLDQADVQRARHDSTRRWSIRAVVIAAPILAACVFVLPWTFGGGVCTLISAAGDFTDILAVANRVNGGFLGYLGLAVLPVIVDVMLLVGIASWLAWVSRPPSESRDSA